MKKIKLFIAISFMAITAITSAQGNFPCTNPTGGGILYASGSAAINSLGSPSTCSNYSPGITSTTITDCFTITSSANGTLGIVQLFSNSGPSSCDATIANSRVATLFLQGGCSNSPIPVNAANGGNSSTFNPEWNQLCQNTTYIVCITTTIPAGCPYTRGCPAFYNAPGTSPNLLSLSATAVDACPNNCDGTATATAGGGTLPYAYSWSSGGTTPSETGLCANTYTITVTDNAGCTDNETVVVSNLTVNTILTLSGNTLTASANPPATYQWIDCDNGNSLIVGETGQSYSPTTNGNYAVIVTEGACSDTSSCQNLIITGVEDLTSSSLINVYPNPAKEYFNFSTTSNKAGELTITDAVGRIIYNKRFSNAQKLRTINTTDFAEGAYYLSFRQGDALEVFKLFIVK